MLNEILLLSKKQKDAALIIYERFITEYNQKYIITISGEVETGKAEVAHLLGRILKKQGIVVKLLHMDSYYKIAPLERTEWRKNQGIESIGIDEYDWDTIYKNVKAFKDGSETAMPCVDLFTDQIDKLTTNFKNVQVLIIEGLYAIKVNEANLKVFMEMTYRETMPEQIESGKEDMDEFRMRVLEQEHKVVQSLKPLADFFLDFDIGKENFHL